MAFVRRGKTGLHLGPGLRIRAIRARGVWPVVWAALACLLIPAAGPARAQDAPQVAVAEFGEYTVLREEVVTDERSGSSGVTDRVSSEGARLLRRTDRIEAVPCRRFGVWFRLNSPGRVGVLPITQRLTHPLMTRPDGRTGTVRPMRACSTTCPGCPASVSPISGRWFREPGPLRCCPVARS